MKNAVSSLTTTPHHSTPLYPLRLREARKTQRDHDYRPVSLAHGRPVRLKIKKSGEW